MEKRIILFLILSMALIVLYPYVMDKMGLTKRPQPVRPQKEVQAPPLPVNPAPPSASRLSTLDPPGRLLVPSERNGEGAAPLVQHLELSDDSASASVLALASLGDVLVAMSPPRWVVPSRTCSTRRRTGRLARADTADAGAYTTRWASLPCT